MNKFLQKDFLNKLQENCKNIINAHPELFCLGLLALACFIFLFYGIGYYPLIDVDETRYAVMARDLMNSADWNSLMLNGVPFLEKPPLYFWMVGASIKAFHNFSPFIVRLPIAIISSFLVFFTYYVGKKVVSRKFGVISSLVLVSSMLFLILSHVAILDMVLTVFMSSALYCYFLTHFCKDSNKKYWWFAFYLFTGLGFLAKGLLALAIPAVIIFIYGLITRTLKDAFKPVNLLPGLISFVAIITPWHVLMYQKYGYLFIRDYFLLHHFARFINSETIGRERPLLYFVPVFLLGFLPWAFMFISLLYGTFKKLIFRFKSAEGQAKDKLASLFTTRNNGQKLFMFFFIALAVIFTVFSSSSTKLPTYILPAFPAASFLMGYYWLEADEKKLHQKSIYYSTVLLTSIFFIASLGAIVAYFFLPDELRDKVGEFMPPAVIIVSLTALYLLFKQEIRKAMTIFAGYILAMMLVIVLAVSQIFNFVYNTGEDEIVQYSKYGSNIEKAQLVTFDFAVKYSAMINYEKKINFITDPDFKELDKLLRYKDGPTFVIVKNKNFKDDKKYLKKLERRMKLVKTGERYSLYAKHYKR